MTPTEFFLLAAGFAISVGTIVYVICSIMALAFIGGIFVSFIKGPPERRVKKTLK